MFPVNHPTYSIDHGPYGRHPGMLIPEKSNTDKYSTAPIENYSLPGPPQRFQMSLDMTE